MSRQPLEVLAQLRENQVDEAQLALRQAQARMADAEQLLYEASRARAQAGHAPPLEPGLSVQDYLWHERKAEARRLALRRAEARCATAQTMRAQALEAVHSAQARLIEAELGRRAPATILARREAALVRATELRREEEADDAHRSRRS